MYDKNSDYALNKRIRDSIVCKSVTGGHIHIRREDFASNDEFERWKTRSDADYRQTEKLNRRYNDRKLSLNEGVDEPFPSAENSPMESESTGQTDYAVKIEESLTGKQYRRLCLYYLEHQNESEIAAVEGVGQQRISKSILTGKRVLEKFLQENFKNRG